MRYHVLSINTFDLTLFNEGVLNVIKVSVAKGPEVHVLRFQGRAC